MMTRLSVFMATALCGGLFSLASMGSAHAQSVPTTAAAATGPGAAMSESLSANPSSATLDAIKKGFEGHFPGVEVTAVNPTPYPGLYEIQLGNDVLYTNEHADYVLQGSLIDTATRTDITAARIAKLSEVAFESLPLDMAIKQVKGTGARKLAVFEDPNCGYCKQLHKTLTQVDNITVYTFLFPILSPDSEIKARNVWCAKDQAAAWRDWILDAKIPPDAQCDTPVDTILALGRKLRVQGTPAIIFADGSRSNGALPLQALNAKLDALN